MTLAFISTELQQQNMCLESYWDKEEKEQRSHFLFSLLADELKQVMSHPQEAVSITRDCLFWDVIITFIYLLKVFLKFW
jgi:hypothetical protein